MGSIMKVVPIADFDLAWHESAIRYAGKNRFEINGEVFPSDEDHAADKKRIGEVKRGLAKLTPAQRRASRWPSKPELKRALEQLSKSSGGELQLAAFNPPWWQGSVSTYNDDRSMITSTVVVNGSRDGTYYCEAHADMLRAFAELIARVAGPQVTFLAEDYSPADFTALIVAEPPVGKAGSQAKKKATPRTTPTAKTTVKPTAKTMAKTKATMTTKTKAKPKAKARAKAR